MLSLETKYLSADFEQENSMLTTRWKSESEFLNESAFKEEILGWLEKLKELRPRVLLIDTTKFGFVIIPDIQEWFDKKIFTAYAEIGVKKKAFLMAEDIFIQVSVEQSTDDSKNLDIEFKHFDNEQEAINWLNA